MNVSARKVRASTMQLLVVAGLTAAALLTVQALPAAASASHQKAAVYDLPTGLTEVDGAGAKLGRMANGSSFTLHTSGLNGGHAYTVWWIVFNYPQYCTHPMLAGVACGFEDLYAPDFGLFGDPRVEALIVRAAGHVVGNNGRASFGGYLAAGESADAVLGWGLANPDGAEVMLDVLDHGAKDPGNVPNQIHTFVTEEGSCNPGCIDHHLTGFPAGA